MTRLRHRAAALRVADVLADDLAVVWLDRAGVSVRAGAGFAALAGEGAEVLGCLPEVADGVRRALRVGEVFEAEAVLRGGLGGVPVLVRVLPTGVGFPAGVLRLTDLRPVRALQAQLAQAQALGDVGRLAGGIAHDFNNLLTAILGAMEDLPAAGEAGVVIRGSAERGAELVRQIMAFGGQQVLRPCRLAVNDALRDLRGLLGRLLGRGIEIVLALEEPGRTIYMDRVAFDRVMLNLAVNARDAMAGAGRLTMTAARRLLLQPAEAGGETIPPGRYVVIEVRDTGAGIPADVLPQIFQPFFTTKRGAGGTGLGLSTVHGIIRQSGGYLAVESVPGQGTCFRITLPSAKPAPAEATAPSPAPPQPQAATRRLLLVEDEAPVRLVAARALRRAGWEVAEAASGEAALEEVAGDLACVVSDVIMPGMDGPALVAALRDRQPGLPALLMSGYADAGQRKSLAALDIAFLAKPFTAAELVTAVASHALAPCE